MPMSNYGLNVYSNYAGGDYYRGDYYGYAAGGIFGKIAGALAGGVKGFLKGGPLGAVGGAARGLLGKGAGTAVATTQLPPPPILRIAGGLMPPVGVPKGTPGAVPKPGVGGGIQRFLPGGESGYIPGAAVGAGAPAGYHWNKSFSYAKGLPPGSFLVRNRAMNPTNPRALRRGARRARAFVAIARRVLAQTPYKVVSKGAGRGRAKARR